MINAFVNMLKIKQLRQKVIWTFALVALVRLIQNVTCPGINPEALAEFVESLKQGGAGGLAQTFNIFTGGALFQFAVGVLGIMPYITASIIMQLLSPVVPQLEKMQKESEEGRQRYQQITRYLTIIICVVQAFFIARGLLQQNGRLAMTDYSPSLFYPVVIISLTGAALLIMWIGEQITSKGLGNGASIIITISIIASLPNAIASLINDDQYTVVHVTLFFALFVAVTLATVALVEGLRKIPLRYARKKSASQIDTGENTYLPLKVNHAGVMPIIFAGALLMFPPMVLQYVGWNTLASYFSHGSTAYILTYGILILLFTFFWVATQFNPIQIADDLKSRSGFIPGYRPGDATAKFLNSTMSRITFAGAIFLTTVAVIPYILASITNASFLITSFFGGTSLLIMVGVVLQTMQQIEVQLVQHNYEGFLGKGRLRTR